MWTAIIESKNFDNGIYTVGVSYTNGKESFSEAVNVTGQDITSLTSRVQSRVDGLNASADLFINVFAGDTVSGGKIIPK